MKRYIAHVQGTTPTGEAFDNLVEVHAETRAQAVAKAFELNPQADDIDWIEEAHLVPARMGGAAR